MCAGDIFRNPESEVTMCKKINKADGEASIAQLQNLITDAGLASVVKVGSALTCSDSWPKTSAIINVACTYCPARWTLSRGCRLSRIRRTLKNSQVDKSTSCLTLRRRHRHSCLITLTPINQLQTLEYIQMWQVVFVSYHLCIHVFQSLINCCSCISACLSACFVCLSILVVFAPFPCLRIP